MLLNACIFQLLPLIFTSIPELRIVKYLKLSIEIEIFSVSKKYLASGIKTHGHFITLQVLFQFIKLFYI